MQYVYLTFRVPQRTKTQMNPANLAQFGQLATEPLTDQEDEADGEADFELVPVCLVDAVQGRDYHRQVAQRIPCEQTG